jgi:hypothetical protein
MALGRASLPLLVLAFSCLVLMAFGPARAEARTLPTATSFGFSQYPTEAFVGQVASTDNRCRNGRLVKLFRETGRRDRLIGRDRGSPTGQWIIEKNIPNARYYALIPKKRVGPGGRDTCRRYKTTTLRFG